MPAAARDSDQSAWSLDTCASFHLTGDRNSFVSFHTGPCPDKIDDTAGIRDASGRIATVSGWGTVLLQTGDGHVKLSHVRYVPSFSPNLLSYAQLEDQGHILGIVPNGFSIRTPEGYVLIASKRDTTRIYQLTSCRTIPDPVDRGKDPIPATYATPEKSNRRTSTRHRAAAPKAAKPMRMAGSGTTSGNPRPTANIPNRKGNR